MRLPFAFCLSLIFSCLAEDYDEIRHQIVKSVMSTITAMSIYGAEDSLIASRFHVKGCRTAAKYDLSRLERYRKLKNAIDSDWQAVFFVRRHGIQRDEFIDDWLNMAEEIEENIRKLGLNGPTTMSSLCLMAFCENFRDGDQQTKTRLLLEALNETPSFASCQ